MPHALQPEGAIAKALICPSRQEKFLLFGKLFDFRFSEK
jgi:hypothetical protein